SMTVTGSAIAQNTAGSRGGGVNNTGTSSYLNTTISSNVAVSRGGGVFNETGASAGMVNVSIADNAAGSRGGGLAGEVSFSTRLSNSLIERNQTDARVPVSNASTNKDVLGVIQSLGFNSIQVLDARQASATTAGLLVSDKFGRDASPRPDLTTALQYGVGNGVGHNALIATGLGVDTGSNSLYPVNPLGQFDAVGNPRLIEGDRDGVITIDLGAVEFLVNTPLALFVATPNPAGLNELITFNGGSSTHPNPALGFIRTWQWDFDWNPTNVAPTRPLTDPLYDPYENFTEDATGVSPTHAYSDPAKFSYTVRLIVTDNFGNKGFVDKIVTVGKPTKPVVLRPFEFTTDQTPTISWQASPGTYRLRVDNFTTGQLDVINVGNLTANNYTPSTKLTPGRYKVIVSATNGSGTSTSDAYFFNVTLIALASPSGSTYDITPIFNWTNVQGTSRYDLWVTQTKPTFKGPVFRNEFVSTNSYELKSSLGLGTFTWWVRAYDADGNVGDWSTPGTFTIGRPSVTGPARNTLDTTPTFTWTNLGSPRYELWVNQVGGKTKIIHQSALTTNSFTPTTPLPNGLYDVWVRTIAADGEAGLWSARYRFQMDYRVGPTARTPVGITTDTTPAFTWDAIDGAVSYNLWVDYLTTGTRQAILANVPHVNGAATITYTHPTSLQSGSYRWWVQAVPADGSFAGWSARTDFQIPVPSLTAPRGNVNTSTPIFRWTGVAEFVAYDLWVNNLTTGVTQVVRERNLPPNPKNFVPSLPLQNGDFRAWIRGIDKDGLFSQWSAIADFTINATISNAPRLISPQTTITNNRPTFNWQGVANATTYEILVKDMTGVGQSTVLNVSNIAALSYTSTVTLAPNRNYRWWVRAVTTNNQPGPWSQPLDFRIVSNDSQTPSDTAGPFDSTQLASIVLTAALDGVLDDDVRSITAHPAGTIVQLTPEAAASFHAELSEPVEFVEQVAEIDAVMEELAFDAFFMGDIDSETTVPITPFVPAQGVISNDTASTSEKAAMEAVTAGLLAAMTMSRTVSDQAEKRKLQR
ncbi:MAG: hypothetical protein O2856_11875, partial [Planctomycetota bacterium]|nr:hypothetical protein [Planctomycetota bacterium]